MLALGRWWIVNLDILSTSMNSSSTLFLKATWAIKYIKNSKLKMFYKVDGNACESEEGTYLEKEKYSNSPFLVTSSGKCSLTSSRLRVIPWRSEGFISGVLIFSEKVKTVLDGLLIWDITYLRRFVNIFQLSSQSSFNKSIVTRIVIYIYTPTISVRGDKSSLFKNGFQNKIFILY